MGVPSVTRGYGLLERFLSMQRCQQADRLMLGLNRSGALLDIGCGSYPLFLIRTSCNEKVGVDKLVVNAKAENAIDGVRLVNWDIEKESKLPFYDEYFVVVTMLAVFEHIEPSRLPVILEEIHRVLKPGGVFIVTTPAIWTDGLLRVLARLSIVSSVEVAEHKDAYSPSKIRKIIGTTAFSTAKLEFGYFEFYMNVWMRATKQPEESCVS